MQHKVIDKKIPLKGNFSLENQRELDKFIYKISIKSVALLIKGNAKWQERYHVI